MDVIQSPQSIKNSPRLFDTLSEHIQILEEEIMLIKQHISNVESSKQNLKLEASYESMALKKSVEDLANSFSRAINLLSQKESELFNILDPLKSKILLLDSEIKSLQSKMSCEEDVSRRLDEDLLKHRGEQSSLVTLVNSVAAEVNQLKECVDSLSHERLTDKNLSTSLKEEFSKANETLSGKIQLLRNEISDTQTKFLSVEMGQNLDRQSNLLYNECEQLHHSIENLKVNLSSTTNSVMSEIETIKSNQLLNPLDYISSIIQQNLTTHSNAVSAEIARLHQRVSELEVNNKVLTDKLGSKYAQEKTSEVTRPIWFQNSSDMKDVLDKLYCVASEHQLLKD